MKIVAILWWPSLNILMANYCRTCDKCINLNIFTWLSIVMTHQLWMLPLKKVKNICDANTTFFHLVWFSTPEGESQGTPLLQWKYILFKTEGGAHFGHKYLQVVTWVSETMCQEKNSGLVLTSKTLHLCQPHHPESEAAINFAQKGLYH